MSFNLLPDGGPPRLLRFVDPSTFGTPSVVAVLDPAKNLLLVDKEVFDLLDREDQDRILKTSNLTETVDATRLFSR